MLANERDRGAPSILVLADLGLGPMQADDRALQYDVNWNPPVAPGWRLMHRLSPVFVDSTG